MLDGLGYRVAHQFDGLTTLPRHDGCAIASRWPFELLEVVSLQVTANAVGYPYAALAARIEAPQPVGTLLLVCAKPSWELNREYERELQAVELANRISRLARREDFPTVLAGDFDATPDSSSIRFLTGKQSLAGISLHYRDAWAEAGDGTAGHTWTYRNGSARAVIDQCFHELRHERRIDYIFLGSPHDYRRRARIVTSRVVLDEPSAGVWPSDHYALFAEIDPCP
jgi:endonuclease/exonuclease/phosphatase family metal-dependent hydrolase